MELIKDTYLVVKHNSLINAKSEEAYSLNQLKLICHLISHIKPEDTNLETKQLSLMDLGFDSIESKNHKKLTSEFLKLLKMPFKIPNSKYWVNWFSVFAYENGVIEYSFDERLKPYLLELKDNFTSYQLKNILSLKKIYSIKLYELLLQNLTIGKRTIEIIDLRALLNIPDGYTNKDIVRLVKDVQKELGEKTDINFLFKPIKKIREFVALEFDIKQTKAIKKEISVIDSLKNLKIKEQ